MRAHHRIRLIACASAVSLLAIGCSSSSSKQSSDTTVKARTYEGAQVTTDKGAVVGTVESATRSFLGIPFAAPPVGDLRWAPPQPAAAWTTPLQATAPGNACVQNVSASYGKASVGIAEDCLYLNVHTPATSTTQRPVMVWFHGGGYTGGMGADYDGRSLAKDNGIIVVTVNYRLGVFGFLATSGLNATSSTKTSGNYGIEDQRAALQWVQHNIAAFGGDPKRVAIAGESAGGGSVCSHLVSPESAGLFHAAIQESGTCSNALATPTLASATTAGDGFAATLGCTGTGADQATCLRGKSADALRDAGGGGSTGGATPIPLRPIVDGKVIPSQPYDLLRSGKFNKVPVISGYNLTEGSTFVYLAYQVKGNQVTPEGYADAVKNLLAGSPRSVDEIVAQYPPSKYKTPSDAVAAARTDSSVCGLNATTELFAAKVPTYAYMFADTTLPFLGGKPDTLTIGVGHGMEMQYLFKSQGIPLVKTLDPGFSAAQLKVSDAMAGFWSAFVTSGVPGTQAGVTWPKYTTSAEKRLVFNPDAPTTDTFDANAHNCSFWLRTS
jgi:para-nitrobenzyl esterase